MRREFILMIVGVFVVVVACCLLVAFGVCLKSSGEKIEAKGLLFLLVVTVILALGIAFISGCFYLFGNGKPIFLSDMKVNHIYEVMGTVSVGKGKVIATLKNQHGKIILTQFDADLGVTGAKFIKIVKHKNGQKTFQLFPPSEETVSPAVAVSPDETALEQEASLEEKKT